MPQQTDFSTGGGFRPPATQGGTIAAAYGTIAYTDATAKALFTLPRGAVIVDTLCRVSTLFNDTGTDLLIVGTAANDDAFIDDLDGSSVTTVRAGSAATAPTADLWGTPLAADTVVYGKFTGQNGNASAGSATFVIWYLLA